MKKSGIEFELEKVEQLNRGKRIKYIRENELHMNKTELAKAIDISAQFLGLVEEGKGNLVYRNLKNLMDLSGHSADYILFGLDDSKIDKTKKCLQYFSKDQIISALNLLQDISIFIKDLE